MTHQTASLFNQSKLLSHAEQGELAAAIIDNLDPEPDEDVAPAWSDEIRNRLAEIESGQVQPISWDDARKIIMDDAKEPDNDA